MPGFSKGVKAIIWIFLCLAFVYVLNLETEEDFADDLADIARKADQGDIDAQLMLGFIYSVGEEGIQDYQKAL